MELIHEALGANETSDKWECAAGGFVLQVRGTWDGATATLQSCGSGVSGTYGNVSVQQVNGTFADFTCTDDIDHIFCLPGQWFQIVMDNTGSPDLDVRVAPLNRFSIVRPAS